MIFKFLTFLAEKKYNDNSKNPAAARDGIFGFSYFPFTLAISTLSFFLSERARIG